MKLLIWGFLLSALLTLVAYFSVSCHFLSGLLLFILVLGVASLQALIQMICFLHLGLESKPHFKLITFMFLAIVVPVVIGGSLWIMYNLTYNMMMS